MCSPATREMYKLRKVNRDLLEKLESNSVLLEERIKKLADTARTSKRSDKSWRNLSPSTLKRRYDSWKARNESVQVPAGMSSDVYNKTSESEDDAGSSDTDLDTNHQCNSSNRTRRPRISPPKRTKRNASKYKSSPIRSDETLKSGCNSSEAHDFSKCCKCSKTCNSGTRRHKSSSIPMLRSSESLITQSIRRPSSKDCYCNEVYQKIVTGSVNVSEPRCVDQRVQTDRCLCAKCLAFDEKQNNKTLLTKSTQNIREKKCSASSATKKFMPKGASTSCIGRTVKQGTSKTPDTRRPTTRDSATSPIASLEVRSPLESSPSGHNRPRFATKHCHRHRLLCSKATRHSCCCMKHGESVKHRHREAVSKESIGPHMEPLTTVGHSISHSGDRGKENFPSEGSVHHPESCWVSELQQYRRSNWFDCHAPTSSPSAPQPKGSWHEHDLLPSCSRESVTRKHFHTGGRTAVKEEEEEKSGLKSFVLNDRLFLQPVDGPKCVCKVLSAGPGVRQKVTLPSRRPRTIAEPREKKTLIGPTKAKAPPARKGAAPANSLALRYQKGVV